MSEDRKQAETLPLNIPTLSYRSPCMDKNDRIAWTHGCCFDAGGIRVGFRSTDSALLDALRRTAPSFWVPIDSREVEILYSFKLGTLDGATAKFRNYHLVYSGWTRLARTFDLSEAFQIFQNGLFSELAQASADYFYIKGTLFSQGRESVLLVAGKSQEAGPRFGAVFNRDGNIWNLQDVEQLFETPEHSPPGGPTDLIAVAFPGKSRAKTVVKTKLSESAGLLRLLPSATRLADHPGQVLAFLAELRVDFWEVTESVNDSNLSELLTASLTNGHGERGVQFSVNSGATGKVR